MTDEALTRARNNLVRVRKESEAAVKAAEARLQQAEAAHLDALNNGWI